jgi:trk system potassium uptake protein TrkH
LGAPPTPSGKVRALRLGRSIGLPPPALLAILYAVLIAAGAALLKLPMASPITLSWSDAVFMATSAVTVTGLVVIDPGTQLTGFGQAVIAALIQLGGLGLMTFAVIVLSSLGLPIGLPQKLFLQEDLGQTSVSKLLGLVVIILQVVLAAVLIGWALLAIVMVPEFGLGEGLWQALFHSISAFNNAGFSLNPDSLTRYATDPLVNIVVPALFITGGLGFAVLSDVFRLRRWRRFSLHTKLMLVGTAALIGVGVGGFAALEWNNPGTLGAYQATGDKLWVAWFQGVTPRTAGFNTTDTAAMEDGTTLLTLVLMVIGGGPTSTAGGIKVTTFIVALLATAAFFRRQDRLHAFGYGIGLEQVLKVMALVTISGGIIVAALFVLLLHEDGDFLDLLFEAASAFGTVGLSQGATGELSDLGRAVICFLMFVGRVGPLTLGFFLATKTPPRVRYPSSPIYLG